MLFVIVNFFERWEQGVSQGASQEKKTQQLGGSSLRRTCGDETKKRLGAK